MARSRDPDAGLVLASRRARVKVRKADSFPVPWNSRTGRLSNVIRVFTSGPSAPDKCSKPEKIRASGGAVEIAWLAPYNTGGISKVL